MVRRFPFFLAFLAWLLPSTVGPLFFAMIAFGVPLSGHVFPALYDFFGGVLSHVHHALGDFPVIVLELWQ